MPADQLEPAPRADAGLGLRGGIERRHGGDRRGTDRGRPGRRRRERRLATMRSLLLSAIALAAPNSLKPASFNARSLPDVSGPASLAPRVSVSIDSAQVIPPAHAYDGFIREAARKYRLDPALIRSVMRMESSFNPIAVSRSGAVGLMQLMPNVAEALGVDDPWDPLQNIMAGAQLLRELLDSHHGNLALTLASYNAGPAAVASHGGTVPPFRETRNYVKRITGWIADERTASE